MGSFSFDSIAIALGLKAILITQMTTSEDEYYGEIKGDSNHMGPLGDGLNGAYTMTQLQTSFNSSRSINICGYNSAHFYTEPLEDPAVWDLCIQNSMTAIW